MVNGEWCSSAAQVGRLPHNSDNAQGLFSIYHSPFTFMALLFAVTLFLSALLLFWVQPLVGKMVLPVLGGTPAVWSTCMLFFQCALLGGYAYVLAVSAAASSSATCRTTCARCYWRRRSPCPWPWPAHGRASCRRTAPWRGS